MKDAAKTLTFDTRATGVCCTEIRLTLRGDVIQDVQFTDGCPGNHRGIVALVRGRRAEEVIDLLLGTTCGRRTTSCPDQLAKALQAALAGR